jgi:hypothetical protein
MGRQVQGAQSRIERLNEAFELTPGTFWQFQMLEGEKLWKETQAKTKNEGHGCDSELIDKNYGGEFFDCLDESDFEIYEGCDLLRMDALYKDRIVIDCTRGIWGTLSTQDSADIHSTESTVPFLEANLAPSDIALCLLVGETILVLCPVANHACRNWLLMVNLDTGGDSKNTNNV